MADSLIAHLDADAVIGFDHILGVNKSETVPLNELPVCASGQNPTAYPRSPEGATRDWDGTPDAEWAGSELECRADVNAQLKGEIEMRR